MNWRLPETRRPGGRAQRWPLWFESAGGEACAWHLAFSGVDDERIARRRKQPELLSRPSAARRPGSNGDVARASPAFLVRIPRGPRGRVPPVTDTTASPRSKLLHASRECRLALRRERCEVVA